METYDLSKITAQDFREYLGQVLQIHFTAGHAVPAKVTKVTDLDSYSPLERSAFSVVLQTEGDKNYRPQGVYRISHPVSDNLEVFLVPIGPDQNGMKYEAVFS
jgi:hypothetical protein